jgi:hypothetical protein
MNCVELNVTGGKDMAKKVKSQSKVKSQVISKPKATAKSKAAVKKQPAKSVTRVPVELVFWCHDGSTFADLRELAEGLAAMSDETFFYHCNSEKQDFANWVRDVIIEEDLAEELARAINRQQAAECVAARLVLNV